MFHVFIIKKEILNGNVRNFQKTELTFYVIIFGQSTFFSIINLVFREKCKFYLFYYNAIFKDGVLLK